MDEKIEATDVTVEDVEPVVYHGHIEYVVDDGIRHLITFASPDLNSARITALKSMANIEYDNTRYSLISAFITADSETNPYTAGLNFKGEEITTNIHEPPIINEALLNENTVVSLMQTCHDWVSSQYMGNESLENLYIVQAVEQMNGLTTVVLYGPINDSGEPVANLRIDIHSIESVVMSDTDVANAKIFFTPQVNIGKAMSETNSNYDEWTSKHLKALKWILKNLPDEIGPKEENQ